MPGSTQEAAASAIMCGADNPLQSKHKHLSDPSTSYVQQWHLKPAARLQHHKCMQLKTGPHSMQTPKTSPHTTYHTTTSPLEAPAQI